MDGLEEVYYVTSIEQMRVLYQILLYTRDLC